MGWNGSSQVASNPTCTKTPKTRSRSTLTKLILVLLAFALIGFGGYCYFFRGDSTPKIKPDADANTRITEVTPALHSQRFTDTENTAEPVKMKTVRNPLTGVEKQVPDIPPKINSNNVSYIGQEIPGNIVNPPRRLFKHRSLGMLAGLVNTKPGATIVGIELPKNFDLDIKDAIVNERIEVTQDDTPEEAETKRMVGEMIEDCKKILAEGGSVRDAVMEERNYLRKVADIRFTLQKEVSKMRREGASEDEISDAVTAANQIMKEYGDVRIRISPFRVVKEGETRK